LRWPASTAVAGSMIGEIGALGGGLIPNAMGLSKQYAGGYFWGFALFAACAVGVLALLRVIQVRWTRSWAGKGGRARETGVPLVAGREAQTGMRLAAFRSVPHGDLK
ncbi:MAG: hypothetical protein ACREWJ_11185, partial [Rhodoferax sp.]